MDKFALAALLQAKAGKEKEVEAFLISAQPLAAAEIGTTSWFAVRLDGGRYGIFDTFRDERGRNAHLNGEIAKGADGAGERAGCRAAADSQARCSGGEGSRGRGRLMRLQIAVRALRSSGCAAVECRAGLAPMGLEDDLGRDLQLPR